MVSSLIFFASSAAQSGGLTKLNLIQDLAAVMLIAGLVAALFHYLGWPKVIGYIAAGALITVSPFKDFLIADEGSVLVLANLGVIFLMFTLGMDLNIRKLKRIGPTIFPTAVWDASLMLLAGYAVGRYVFKWDMLPSLFLGAVICDSSTTLLAKSLEEMGCSKAKFASIIFGVTLTEDVLTIGLMAILTGLALTGQFQAAELAKQLTLLVLFLVGVLVFGLLLLPKFLNRLQQLKDDETLLAIVLGVCFGVSFVAEKMNFSLALGAFLVGAVVAESTVLKRVHDRTGVLRSMFSAVFFVTIGLMVNPAQMWQYKWAILLVVVVVLVGKTINCMIGAFVTGQPFRESVQIGVGLAQLGDFAYLVALMGLTLSNNASPYPEMYQIAVGVSVITTLINPFLLRNSVHFSAWLERSMPARLQRALDGYTRWADRTIHQVEADPNRGVMRRHLVWYVLDLAMLVVVFMIAHYLDGKHQLWQGFPGFISRNRSLLLWVCSCIVTLPFLVSGFLHARQLGRELGRATVPQVLADRWALPLRRLTIMIIIFFAMSLMAIAFWFLSNLLLLNRWIFVITLAVYGVICWKSWHKVKAVALEGQKTLNDVLNREDAPEHDDGDMLEAPAGTRMVLAENSGACDMTLGELRLRNRTGASIFRLQRTDGSILENPGATDVLKAGDQVYLVGSESQLEATRELLAQREIAVLQTGFADMFELHTESLVVPDNSPACHRRLADLQLRNQTGVSVVRIERQGQVVTAHPGPDDVLEPGDLVYILGTDAQLADAKDFLLGIPNERDGRALI